MYIPNQKKRYSEIAISARQRIQCDLHVDCCCGDCDNCIFNCDQYSGKVFEAFLRWEIKKGFMKPEMTWNGLKNHCEELEKEVLLLKRSNRELREMLNHE